MQEDEWQTVLSVTHSAVLDFGTMEFEALVRKAVHCMQRISASGIFGDDYLYKSLWDEYCHEVQEGPHDHLEWAFEQTLDPLLDGIVEKLPRHIAALLSIAAVWDLDEEDSANIVGAVWLDGIKTVLLSGLSEKAGHRNLHRLGPWRNS